MESTEQRPPVWTGHVILRSGDPEQAARFYETIGMRRIAVMGDVAVMEMRGGTHLAIRLDPENVDPGPAPWDLMVEDLDTTHAEWTEAGLDVTDIHDTRFHRAFELTDPDGHVIEVSDSHVEGIV